MTRKMRILVAGTGLLMWGGAVGATALPPEEIGARAAAALKGNLMAALGKALAEGGVPEAIRVCSRDAVELTQESGKVHEAVVSVGRRTDRWRNAKNRADEGDLKVIEAFRQDPKLQEQVQEESEEVIRYYQPLRTAAACLQCHGDPESFSPEVKTLLEDIYPEDRATGLKEGDLRGVIRVRIRR